MEIKVSELHDVFEKLLKHLKDSGYQSVDIPYDYYWNIPKKSRYDITKDLDVGECDLGQLTDDWENLQEIAQGNSPPISYALVWLSEILKVIGEEIIE